MWRRVGEGQETGNPAERRFSTNAGVGTFSATAVIASETEATASVKVVPVLVLWPPEQTAPQHPTDYLPYSAQVFPEGAASVEWSGAGWNHPENSMIRYINRDVLGTHVAFAQAGESQQQQVRAIIVPNLELRLVLDVNGDFNPGALSDDSAAFVPGANLDGTSRPVAEVGGDGQLVRLIAYYVDAAAPNRIASAPPGSSATFFLENTSAWTGFAMNAGSQTGPDYIFPAVGVNPESSQRPGVPFGDGNIAVVEMRVRDYGGRTQVRATASTGHQTLPSSLPRDNSNNWLPDAGWKATTGTGVESVQDNVNDPWSDADSDIGPQLPLSPVPPDDVPLNHGWFGDGLIRFHEYRGFVVQGTHVRTDPRRLDIFMSHNVVRTDNQARLTDALDFAKSSLNQFRITLHELYDQLQQGFTAEYQQGGPINFNVDPGQAIAGYLPSTTYQRALRIANGGVQGKWGNTTGSCGPPGQPAQSGLIPMAVTSMVVDVGKLFNDGSQMPAFTTAMILNEVRKVVGHEIGHGIHISHRPQSSGQQCADSANLGPGGTVSVMNDDQPMNGQDASFQGSRYNAFDIRHDPAAPAAESMRAAMRTREVGSLGTRRPMRRLIRCGIVLITVLAGMAPQALPAQDRGGESRLSADFRIIDSDEIPAPPVRSRLYGEPRQLRFKFSVTNRQTSNRSALVDMSRIQETFGLIIEREMEIPIALQWLDGEITVNYEPTALQSTSWVRLEPKEQIAWTIVAERADGRPFEQGQYYLTVGFVGVRSAVRSAEGTAWQGEVSEGIGQWSLVVGPPTTTAERVRMHEIAGEAALSRGDMALALSEYAQLLEVDPANVGAQIAIGNIHLRAGRYREAITWWERAAPNVSGDRYHSVRLAYAYVAAGEDHKAGEVLRAAKFDDERVALELDRARRAAIERPEGVPIRPATVQVVAPAAAIAIAPDGPAPDPQQLLQRLRETAEREAARRKASPQ